MNKKRIIMVAAVLAVILGIGGAAVLLKGRLTDRGTAALAESDSAEFAADGSAEAAYMKAEADLVFWYEDETYTDFLEMAAVRYFAEKGVKVALEYHKTIDYIGDIYERTMQDDGFPDVYLTSGDNLEEAYLYGLVSVNESNREDAAIAQNALLASAYEGKNLGYPLSYNTCVFIYQPAYFEEVPESIQAIIDYSRENEPEENVEYLLEWDVNDAFYDFPFISNSVSFEKSEAEYMEVVYDETLYEQDLAFFEEILQYFSVDADGVSEDSIIENFLAGKTLCAIIDTDSLYRLEDYHYSVTAIPRLNDSLATYSCAITDMLLVNEFTEHKELAADFAEYVTVELADELHRLSGHYSVVALPSQQRTERVAYQIYEESIPVPNSLDARDFWVDLAETISKYF